MKNSSPFSIHQRVNSIKHALCGLFVLFTNEANAKIHLMASFVVITLGFILNINAVEWLFVVAAIGFVLLTEALNTSIEYLSDVVSPEANIQIGQVKDVAAGGVLIAGFTAFTIGCIIFIPKLLNLISL